MAKNFLFIIYEIRIILRLLLHNAGNLWIFHALTMVFARG